MMQTYDFKQANPHLLSNYLRVIWSIAMIGSLALLAAHTSQKASVFGIYSWSHFIFMLAFLVFGISGYASTTSFLNQFSRLKIIGQAIFVIGSSVLLIAMVAIGVTAHWASPLTPLITSVTLIFSILLGMVNLYATGGPNLLRCTAFIALFGMSSLFEIFSTLLYPDLSWPPVAVYCGRLASIFSLLGILWSWPRTRPMIDKTWEIISTHPAGIISVALPLYLLPLIILGHDAHLQIRDYLDNAQLLYLPVRGPDFWTSIRSIIPNELGGIPRFCYLYTYNVALPYRWLDVLTVHIIYQVVMRIVAYWGACVLLEKVRQKLEGNSSKKIVYLTSLCFALLPFYPADLFRLAGLPFMVLAFWNARDGHKGWSVWIGLTVVPWFSSYFMGPFYLLPLACLLWLWDFIRLRKVNLTLLLAIGVFTAVGLVWSYGLLRYIVIDPQFATNRDQLQTILPMFSVLTTMLPVILMKGYPEAITKHYMVWPALFMALILAFQCRKLGSFPSIIYLMGTLLALSIFGIYATSESAAVIKSYLPFLKPILTIRIVNLLPVFWLVLFFVCLHVIGYLYKHGQVLSLLLVCAQAAILFYGGDIHSSHGYQGWLDIGRSQPSFTIEKPAPYISFRHFVGEKVFDQIKQAIGRDPSTYRVACLGFHPSVALFNGLYTVGGYTNIYPLAYQQAFRRIIAKELEKNSDLGNYFDRLNHSNRCYLFSAELFGRFDYTKNQKKSVQDLDLDLNALGKLNGQYILSTADILNFSKLGLRKIGVYDHPTSAWRIYLYEVPAT